MGLRVARRVLGLSRVCACLLGPSLLLPTGALAQTAGVSRKLGSIPPVPPFPPPPAVIPPVDNAPPHPTALPPPPAVNTHAIGTASPLPGGLRITFAQGGADLNPSTDAAIGALARLGQRNPDLVYQIYAYAPGTPEDPSTPRRLSLLRGLAVQSALLHSGILSTHVYVHALGARGLDGKAPADRVDIRTGLIGQSPGGASSTTPAEVPKP